MKVGSAHPLGREIDEDAWLRQQARAFGTD
jgi:hypothetical protein